jgi:uncharacterized heparinase superfamily protein
MRFKTFPHAGYTVIRSTPGLIFTFDHGPLGLAPLYNHGHADALSVTLEINNKALLVDPGTYRYNGRPELRQYFKGTRAHNTVTVDGMDQAVQETGFIWSHPYHAALNRFEERNEGLILEGCQDGYRRLPNPVEHHRTVFFFPGTQVLIRDTFAGTGTHDFELNFHLHPEAKAHVHRDRWLIKHDREEIYLGIYQNSFAMITGQEDPPLGWYSPAYGSIMKSSVLSCRQKGEVEQVTFLTLISLGTLLDSPEVWERATSL